MNQPFPDSASPSSYRLDRRELMILAAAMGAGGARGAALGDGPAKFAEPATVADYMSTMRLGTQAGDYLEMINEPAGLRNQVTSTDFDIMRNEGRFDHVRIPAICSARADVDGVVPEVFLAKLDAQIHMALQRFERVVFDPLHHYLQWKGNHTYDRFLSDPDAISRLTSEQHAVRATAIWTQLATRYKDVSLRLSFDLFNEPGIAPRTPDTPAPQTPDELNAWHPLVIQAIRATGGKNRERLLWLEPFYNRLDLLTIPPDAGPIGVSPHYYSPFLFTHRSGQLTAAGMSSYVEDIRYAKRWGQVNRVPIWIGEAGVSVAPEGSKQPRPPADRAEYTAHLRNTALELKVPVCYWGYNSGFAQYDQVARQWMPGMRQAVSGLPTPLPVREIPAFIQLKGGRIARSIDPKSNWEGFSYDPKTGVLTAQSNVGGPARSLVLVFPDIPVASGQTWIARASEFTGSWQVGTIPVTADESRSNNRGVPGVDLRASNLLGRGIYPGYRPGAPGGFENAYGDIATENCFFAIDLILAAGSPGGSIRFACIRAV